MKLKGIMPGGDGQMVMEVRSFITLNTKKKQVDYNMATSFWALYRFGSAILQFSH